MNSQTDQQLWGRGKSHSENKSHLCENMRTVSELLVAFQLVTAYAMSVSAIILFYVRTIRGMKKSNSQDIRIHNNGILFCFP